MDTERILDALDAAVYAKDLQGNYTYANRYVRDLFGADLQGIVGKDDSHFFDLERSNALKVNDAEVMSTGVTVEREERDIVKETGEERFYWTMKSPLRDDSGVIIGMCGISLDITDARR